MTDTAAAADLLDELTLMPYGPAHRERATQVVAIAQERGDKGLEFDARMRLTDEGAMRGVADLALANFAWCAAAYKDDASLVTGDATRAQSFFWQHKWMPGILTGSPAFDRTQIDAVLDDMEATFRDAGLGLSAVASARFETATSLGDLADAERLGEDLESLPRDDYSSCEACIPAGYVDLELLRRDGAAAAQIAISAWREHQVCAHEPETMLARTLVAMLESGRLEDAAEAFDFVCRSSRTEPDKLLNMALAAQFASLTGHHDLALDLVERHVGWLAHDALHERAPAPPRSRSRWCWSATSPAVARPMPWFAPRLTLHWPRCCPPLTSHARWPTLDANSGPSARASPSASTSAAATTCTPVRSPGRAPSWSARGRCR